MRLFAIAAVLTATAVAALAQDDYKTLPPGTGRDVTVKVCSQCHSPELASSQRLDPQGWKDLVAQMANNGAQATDDEFAQVTQYLATAFPPGAAPAGAAPAAAAPAAGAAPATGVAPATAPATDATGATAATPPAGATPPATTPPAQ